MAAVALARLLVLALVAAPALAGCIGAPSAADDADAAAAAGSGAPLAALPDVISGLAPIANLQIDGANDLAFKDHYAYVASYGGMSVVDVSDPANPVEVAVVDCAGKDIGAIDLADGRRIVTISFQADDNCPDASPSGGIRLVDVTDATRPVVLGQVPLRFGSHTHTPYGDSGIIYNSAYDLTNPLAHHRSEIVDVSDPDAPKVAAEFLFPDTSASHGCHDILAEPEFDRAICAGITETMIWDTTDPLAPVIVGTIHNPGITIHHSAATARNGTLLILGDEWAGVLVPACGAEVAPAGALWFYDIEESAAPRLLGYWAPPAGSPLQACTAHNFNVVPGRDLVVSAFYSAGTALVDFSDPTAPTLVDHVMEAPSNAWASYHYEGVVFVGDSVRGLDVLAFE